MPLNLVGKRAVLVALILLRILWTVLKNGLGPDDLSSVTDASSTTTATAATTATSTLIRNFEKS